MARLLYMVAGSSATGKSASLRNLENPEGVLYLNYETQKPLPFPDKFKKIKGSLIATQVGAYFDAAEKDPNIHTIVIDSVTFLMDLFESQEVLTSNDTRRMWGEYAQFFKNLMQEKIASSTKNVILLAHNKDELLPNGEYKTFVPVKGSLANNGLEAYLSIVVYTKVMKVKDLKEMDLDPELLHITEEEEALGFKYVFQTRMTKDTANSRIRSPMGLFKPNQTYMDNDVQLLNKYLENYYDI